MKFKDTGILAAKLIVAVLALWILDLFFGGLFFPLPYRSLAPFNGKVVDAETKEPISGAVVLAVYETISHTPGGEVDHITDGQETLTGENGEFSLPRTRRWLVLRRGYPKGRLIIFKPGYGTFPNHVRSAVLGVNISNPPPGKFVQYELPKLSSLAERRDNVRFLSRYNEIPHNRKKIYWELVNEELKNVKLPINSR
jgi:hypothetical protein